MQSGGNRPQQSVLVLEDDTILASALEAFLESEGWDVECAATAGEARAKLSQKIFDLVLADYLLPDADGLTVFDEIQTRSPLTKVMLMTGVQDMQVAARAFKKGASDLISKPFELDELQERIETLMRGARREIDDQTEKGAPARSYQSSDMVGQSAAIAKIFQLIGLVADKNASVLITGESGTGKELVARAIHEASPRRDKPFVAAHCGAIPENLLEDEMFGHAPGAYTDARQARMGKFEKANGGTLFLDEIATMPLSLQVKLLRVLEDRRVERLGGSESIRVDVRIVAATNCELQTKVSKGEFREDLFYRLNVVPIHVPPLTERKEDIPLLATHFLAIFSREYKLPEKRLVPEVLRQILSYDWPGNVRELRNVLEFACVLSGQRTILGIDDFPTICSQAMPQLGQTEFHNYMTLPEEGIDLNKVMDELERNLILQSLERAGGNKGEAARLLFLKRTTLVEKLRRMNRLET